MRVRVSPGWTIIRSGTSTGGVVVGVVGVVALDDQWWLAPE